MPVPLTVRRRLEYARGYLELGMANDAEAEVAGIPAAFDLEPAVLEVRVDIAMELKVWPRVVVVARVLAETKPETERGWIAWAYALRELQQIEEAKNVLLRAEPHHGAASGILHYNLACYYCLLGDLVEADRRLGLACAMDRSWRDAALEDPDLKTMRSRIVSSD